MYDNDSSILNNRDDRSKDGSKKGNKKYLNKINQLSAGIDSASEASILQTKKNRYDKRFNNNNKYEVKSQRSKDTTIEPSLTQDNFTLNYADQRKEKNKESAKNTRRRKKIYIELLENKISELNMELNFIHDQIKLVRINQNTDNIMKIIYCFKNLSDVEDSQMIESARDNLEAIRSKSPIQIPERKQLIQSHFDQFIDHCQTPFLRYFANTALQNKDFFSQEKDKKNPSEVYLSMKEELSLNKKQLTELRALHPAFTSIAQKFKA